MSDVGLVTFRADGRRYAIGVAHVAAVRERGPVRPLPAPLPGVLGVTDDGVGPGIPVLAPFGADGDHLVVVDAADGTRFAVVVDEVERVRRVAVADVHGPPAGQASPLVTGTVGDALVLDPVALAAHLRGAGDP